MAKAIHIDGIVYSQWHPIYDPRAYVNIEKNLKKSDRRLDLNYPEKPHTNKIALVGYGPSLHKTWPYIKEHYDQIMTCSGAHNFLIEKGVIPTYHVECDPKPHKAKFTEHPHKDTQYLIATTCDGQLVDNLLDQNLTLWNLNTGGFYDYPEGEFTIKGAGSAGLQLPYMAYHLGYRYMGVFGMDCSYGPDGNTHAGAHERVEPREICIYVLTGDYRAAKNFEDYECFPTEYGWVIYAMEWRRIMQNQFCDVLFEVLGTGLMPSYLMQEVNPRYIGGTQQVLDAKRNPRFDEELKNKIEGIKWQSTALPE